MIGGWMQSVIRVFALCTTAVSGAYATYAAATWWRYGRVSEPRADERDVLLDTFMPTYEVVERHQVRIAAPADVALIAAETQDLIGLPLVRMIFKVREIVLGATPSETPQRRELLSAVQALGWGVLAVLPGREVVMGAVTKPWEPNVTFRAVPPDAFATFSEPGFVKIAWTLRADPTDPRTCVFRTETRAIATDTTARARFRRYWAFASPGISLIRRLSLRPLKRQAEKGIERAAVPVT